MCETSVCVGRESVSVDEKRHVDLFRIDDLVVDRGQRRVFRGDDEIKLPKLSFDLLVALSDAAPNSLSIDEIIQEVWNGTVVSPATVAKRIELLRQAVGEDSANTRYIALVRGYGYRLIPTPSRFERDARTRTLKGWLAATAIVTIIAVAAGFLSGRTVEPPMNSIAVLPFAKLGHEIEGEYLSDGLAIELTDRLAMIPDFKVAARTSAFAYKGRDIDVTDIAGQLRVAHILTGSVQQSGGRVRISAQLVDARHGFHVWSNNWELELKDIFDIQDEITAAVIRSLEVELLQGVPASQPADPEAYSYYLKSRQAFSEDNEPDIGESEVERHVQALSLATHALAIDPDYAPAWGLLAAIQYNQAQWATDNQAQVFARAEASARRAIELNPDEVAALSVLGGIADSWHWDSESAANWLRRALVVAPGNASTLNSASLLYRRLGRTDISHRYLLAAYERDPFNKTLAINLALSYWVLGDFDAATAQLEYARELAPRAIRVQVFAGMLAYLEGDFETAARQFESFNQPMYACSLYRMERLNEALTELEDLRSGGPSGALGVANVYACRNDKDSAFEWLERAYEDRAPGLRWARAEMLFESLHTDPRWGALLDELGLSDEIADSVSAQLGSLGLQPE